MSVVRSVMIAAGAGVAGLAMGLVLGQGQLFASGSTASAAEPAGEVPDGAYMIVMGTVHDRPAFFSGYMPGLPELYARHGGRYMAVTGEVETLEGETGFQSIVLSRWPDMQSARDFWDDPDYRALANARIDGEWGDFNVVLVPALPARTE
ncbi:DUF1330 domain-containing protein [Hyphomonadaceae bacterium BL14]|nr:DUF1330 domain-containing protein [Hyphomonadaceae bacterium BL14]